jgi:hypothetical protein
MGHSVRASSYKAKGSQPLTRKLSSQLRAGRSLSGQPSRDVSRFSGQARSCEALAARQLVVDLAGDVALEDADDLGLGAALFEPALHVGLGGRMGS